jgi:hypothetical protein
MSLTIAEAVVLLKKPGTRYSGSDWKYGWPHKFYIGSSKVYNEQLQSMTDEEVAAWSVITEEFFGIKFYRENGKTMYGCDYPDAMGYGYQRAGVVGPDSKPVRDDNWNLDFPGRLVN